MFTARDGFVPFMSTQGLLRFLVCWTWASQSHGAMWSMLMPEPDPIFLAVPAQLQPAARRDSVFDNLLLPVASLVLAAGAAAVLAVDLLPSIEAGMDPGLQPALAGAYPFAGMGAMGAAAGEWQSVGGLQPGLQADAANSSPRHC